MASHTEILSRTSISGGLHIPNLLRKAAGHFVIKERSQTPLTAFLQAGAERGSDFPGTRLQDFWQVWAKNHSHPRVVSLLQHGYCLDFKFVKNSAHFERISQQKQRWHRPRSSSGRAYKQGDNSCEKTHYSGILQQTVSGTQTHEKVATSDRFKYVEHPFTCSNFQNGNSRIYQEVDSKRGVGHLDRPHRCLLSEISNKKGVFQFRALPFGVATTPLEFTRIVKEVKLSLSQEPQNPSISGRLAS